MDKLIPAFIELNLEVQNKFQLISSLVDKFDQKGILSEKKEFVFNARSSTFATICPFVIGIFLDRLLIYSIDCSPLTHTTSIKLSISLLTNFIKDETFLSV